MGEPQRAAEPSASPKKDGLIGRVINDRFKILELIARGGMGRVYRARQEPLGREVALKVLDPRYKGDEDPEFQARFFLEASTAAKLSHPNTVTVFDYGKTSDDIYFIVMELVEGRTLSSMLKSMGALPPQRAIHIALQMARSVREAHGLGVIHRDLKPANVLITTHADEEDFVKVLDFGLVKDLEDNQELTQQGLFMGSPKYMSPEQIQGGRVDARTDVYSLGVIIYYMLTGKVPFEGATQVQTLMAHVKNQVPPMEREDGVPIPQELQNVVLRTLSKDIEIRYPSMNDLILALKQASGMMGAPMSSSQSISISGEYETGAIGTPSGGMPQLIGTPSGGIATQLDDALDVEVEGEGGGSGKKWIFAAVAAAVIGAGVYFVTQNTGTEPEVANDTTQETEQEETSEPTEAVGAQAEAAGSQEAETEAENTVPAEEAAPARCQVTITSTPTGAEVFVGERSYGTTPARIVWVGESAEPGREVTFRFEKNGYRSESVTRTVEGETLAVEAELRRRFIPRRGGPSMTTTTSMMDDDPGFTNSGSNYRDNPY